MHVARERAVCLLLEVWARGGGHTRRAAWHDVPARVGLKLEGEAAGHDFDLVALLVELDSNASVGTLGALCTEWLNTTVYVNIGNTGLYAWTLQNEYGARVLACKHANRTAFLTRYFEAVGCPKSSGLAFINSTGYAAEGV